MKYIDIVEPCRESWAGMNRNKKGRFCSVCSKTVMDLTTKTKEEILALYEASEGKLCGRVGLKQLISATNQTLVTANKLNMRWWKLKRWMVAATMGIALNGLTLLDGYAQNDVPSYKLTIIDSQSEHSIEIRGVVVDKNTQEPIVGAMVSIDSMASVITNATGYFNLKIRQVDIKGIGLSAQVYVTGYKKLIVSNIPAESHELSIQLEPLTVVKREIKTMGVMMMGGFIPVKPKQKGQADSPYNVTIIKPKP